MTISHHEDHEHHDRPAFSMSDAVVDSEITTAPVLDKFLARTDVDDPARILDLGCGPGVASVELARRWPNAEVVALDDDEATLRAATKRAETAGTANRTTFVRASFDRDVTGLVEPVDLIWASMSLHHAANPAAALEQAVTLLREGGRIVVAEFGRPLVILPDSAPPMKSGAWGRWQNAVTASRDVHLGHNPSATDWLQLLCDAGITDGQQLECPIEYAAPLSPSVRTWLLGYLRMGLQFAADSVEDADRAAIETLMEADNPEGIELSSTVYVDTSRFVYTGIRTGPATVA